MSWIEELYNTYENCYGQEEIPSIDGKRAKKPLLPLFHKLQNSHIEIRIDGEGNFIDASLIESKNDQEIIIPCTEKSSSRTSGEEPHPLCDKIQYCAEDYTGNKKSYFISYSRQLEKWANSDFSHPMVKVISKYAKKGTLYTDIIGTGKQFGKPGDDLADLLVRWKVEIYGENETRCWKNRTLFKSWQLFSESQESVEDICMVTGYKKSIALNHPNRIRNSGDSARLISSNDKSGFTFLGRFKLNDVILNGKKEEIAVQSASISVEVSQKAHSALLWLIDRQSFRNGDQVIVSWAISGQETPDLLADSLSLFDETDEEKINEVTQLSYTDAGQTFARKLTKKIAGYKAELKDATKIVVMGLDSAGPGRLSIIYYRELSNSEFLERIEKWHAQMAWFFLEFFQDTTDKKKKHSGYMVIAPAPRTIAEACYGKRLDDKLKKSTVERLLPCIVDGRQVPIDLVDSAVKRASNKIGMEHWEWERTLSVACALYRCHSIRNSNNLTKKEYTMALETERTDRDYLYGRLLAVAEHIEEAALHIAKENRDTMASRLMQRFADYPYSTWRNIELSLKPYESRILAKWPGFLMNKRRLIDEIHTKFETGEYEKDTRLSGAYLLGYHCQRLDLSPKKSNNELEMETENNNL
ncbi:MAG: type I-C CRISPR-associated protein Cas8c/Csd1 [Odoribacter sp.]|nr:type I-C CRISPR-associated protein Cas8c/Csd1 [Odoribacter sp.]